MTWISDNLQILATLGSAWAVYYFLRKPICKVEQRLEKVEDKLQSLDSRISRIEGQLIGSPHWEPKIREREEK